MKFPVDEFTLTLVRESMDANNNITLSHLRGFFAGHDEHDVTVIREADPIHGGWDGAEIVEANTPKFHPNDIILALIDEIERLRAIA